MYYGVRILGQTSNPTPPIDIPSASKLQVVADRMGSNTFGYAIDAEDWVLQESHV